MGKNDLKWFLCFRPSPTTIEIDATVDCSANRVLTYIAAAKKKSKEMKKRIKEMKRSTTTNSTETAAVNCECQTNSSNHDRKSFTAAGLAMSETNNKMKFLRLCKLKQQHSKSSRRVTAEGESGNVNSVNNPSSSSVSSSEPEDDQLNLQKKDDKQKNQLVRRRRREVVGGGVWLSQVLWLVLFSLWMTVFWGKVLAVMTTTVGIYAWESRRKWPAGLNSVCYGDKRTTDKIGMEIREIRYRLTN